MAGVLLCTRNPKQWLPNACIMATRYRGKDRASGQIDAQEIYRPAEPTNRRRGRGFALRNMHVASRKEPARVDLPQYSDKALFEALVNAVAHRDYSVRASKIRLSMFEDRLEIQSPGRQVCGFQCRFSHGDSLLPCPAPTGRLLMDFYKGRLGSPFLFFHTY